VRVPRGYNDGQVPRPYECTARRANGSPQGIRLAGVPGPEGLRYANGESRWLVVARLPTSLSFADGHLERADGGHDGSCH